MTFEHTASERPEDAVSDEAQHGKADNSSEHQVKAHPLLAITDEIGEADLGSDQLGSKQPNKRVRETDADPGEKLRRGRRDDDAEEYRAWRGAHVLRCPKQD